MMLGLIVIDTIGSFLYEYCSKYTSELCNANRKYDNFLH